MSQLQDSQSELTAWEADCGTALPEASGPQDLLTQLRCCSEVVQKQIERAHEQLRDTTSFRRELVDLRSENDRLRAVLEDLWTKATDQASREDELRAEATAERDRAQAALAARRDLEGRLVEAEVQIRAATEKSDRFESAAQAAQERLIDLQRENVQKRVTVDPELEAARVCIEQLTADLHRVCSANERLRSLLNVFGLAGHLDSCPRSDRPEEPNDAAVRPDRIGRPSVDSRA